MTMNIVRISLSSSLRCTSTARVLAQPVSSFWSLLRTHYSSRMPEPTAGNGNAHQPRTIRRLVDALIFCCCCCFAGGGGGGGGGCVCVCGGGGGLAFIFYFLNQLKSAKHLSLALFRPEMTLCGSKELKHNCLLVQLSSVQHSIYALGKTHKRSSPSLRRFPKRCL